MTDALPPGLKPDPELERWLQRQESQRRAAWARRDDVLMEYREATSELARVLQDCPDDRWTAPLWEVTPSDPFMSPRAGSSSPPRAPEEMQVFGAFWYVAFHTIFYLDFYLSQLDPAPYAAPKPFGGEKEHDVDADGLAILPYRDYSREQLLAYLSRAVAKAETVLSTITVTEAGSACPPTSAHAGKPFSELLQIALGHVREHTRQLRESLEAGGRDSTTLELG